MKKSVLLALVLSLTASSSFAFPNGARFKCADDVSGATYELEIMDIGTEVGSLVIYNQDGSIDTYGEDQVYFHQNSVEASWIVNLDKPKTEHRIDIEHKAYGRNKYLGTYIGASDSRAIDCVRLK